MTLQEIIKARRSVRRFTDQQVPREAILHMLDMARWAPYASACWRFVVVQEQEGKERLAEAAEQAWIATAPVIIVVGADTAAFIDRKMNLWYRWDAYKWRGLFYIQDTAVAIQNLMLTATDLGLGTCWIGSFNEGRVSEAVTLGPNIRPVAMVPVGYPAKAPPKGSRGPLEDVVFWEKFS